MADDGLLSGDFSRFEQLLAAPERETLHRVRDWLAAEVVPIANRCWERAESPFELIGRFAGSHGPQRVRPSAGHSVRA